MFPLTGQKLNKMVDKKCKGLQGLIYGHNFQELKEYIHQPHDKELTLKALEIIKNTKNTASQTKRFNTLLAGRSIYTIVGVYCTRCGLKEYYKEDNYV